MPEYNALAGKARAMFGRLLTDRDYTGLMSQSSVAKVASYLSDNTNYGQDLSGLDLSNIHRGQLENILKKSLLNDFRKLFFFSRGSIKSFLKLLYLKYEVECLKRIFRILETSKGTVPDEASLMFLKKYDTLNISKLAKSRNTQELTANLENTVYYSALRPFLTGAKKQDLFHIEMSLDIFYLNLVFENKNKLLSGFDMKAIDLLLGTEIDILNLLWIYRGKMVYNLDRSVIFGYLIPHRYKISMEIINELMDAKDYESFIEILGRTKYAGIFEKEGRSFFELNYSDTMYKLHRKFFRKHVFSIAGAVSYLHLKEFEISNIISIVEGIRYGLPAEDIKPFVIGYQNT